MGLAVLHDERAIGQIEQVRHVVTLRPRIAIHALAVKLGVDRVRAVLAWMKFAPDRDEAVVVLAAA